MKRGKVKKIELNIPNRVFYFLIIIIILIAVGAGVYAFGGTSPSVAGHTMGEIRPPCSGILTGTANTDNSWGCIGIPVSCTGSNQFLQYSASSKTWSCATLVVGSACDWTGWEEICFYPNWCQFDYQAGASACSSDPLWFTDVSRYCYNGVVTQTKNIECCPNHGGDVCLAPQPA